MVIVSEKRISQTLSPLEATFHDDMATHYLLRSRLLPVRSWAAALLRLLGQMISSGLDDVSTLHILLVFRARELDPAAFHLQKLATSGGYADTQQHPAQVHYADS